MMKVTVTACSMPPEPSRPGGMLTHSGRRVQVGARVSRVLEITSHGTVEETADI